MFSKFGRRIFSLYEKQPLLMNTCAGAVVYAGGEIAVQVSAQHELGIEKKINWKRVGNIAALGSCENGVLMSLWYWCLTRAVGASVQTPVVLFKCLLDQLFFSTQQNGIFLGLCAVQDNHQLAKAIEATRQNFLTTWINDCAVWPLINFVGFAYVPTLLQPTYMSCVQFFWQTYVSSVACSNKEVNAVPAGLPSYTVDKDGNVDVLGVQVSAKNTQKLTELLQLKEVFNAIDEDNSGFLDSNELKHALASQGVYVSDSEVLVMIKEADENSDGQVSFEEFVTIAEKTNTPITTNAKDQVSALNTQSKLWQKVVKGTNTLKVQKGALSVLKTIEDFETTKANKPLGAPSTSLPNAYMLIPVGVCMNDAANSKTDSPDKDASEAEPVGLVDKVIKTLRLLETPESLQNEQWKEDRANAQSNATIGLGILCVVALVRVIIFKK